MPRYSLLLLCCLFIVASSKNSHRSNSNDSVGQTTENSGPNEEDLDIPWHQQFWMHLGMSLLCVCVAAVASGLTMGLLSIDPMQLQIILNTSEADLNTEEEKKDLQAEKLYAAAIQPLVLKHHILLVTLLLLCSVANEALPLFLDRLVPSWVAVILSVTLVLFCGEIIPSAIFTGPGQLSKAAALSGVVKFFMCLLLPISFPIAKLLDYCLGEELGLRYRHAELKALVSLQHNRNSNNEAAPWEGEHVGLTDDEVTIIHGALAMKKLSVGDIMTPLNKVFMLSMEAVLDADTLALIMASGHSRIPIYETHPHNIRGMLLVNNLIVLNPEDRRKVSTLGLRELLLVQRTRSLLEVLNEFQSARTHLAIVCDRPDAVKKALKNNEIIPPHVHMAGIIALEDVLEKLIQEPIYDEKDMFSGSRSVRQQLDIAQKRAARLKKLRSLVEEEKARALMDEKRQAVAETVQVAVSRVPPFSARRNPSSSSLAFPSTVSCVSSSTSERSSTMPLLQNCSHTSYCTIPRDSLSP